MTSAELREEIAIELENIETVLRELSQLRHNVRGREASLLEKTAASAFLAQFYNGLENILKRISRYCNMPLPTGEKKWLNPEGWLDWEILCRLLALNRDRGKAEGNGSLSKIIRDLTAKLYAAT